MYQPAKRRGTKLLVGLTGFSGSGKTVSALRLARGIAGPNGLVCLMDTESGRGSMYAGDVPEPGAPPMVYDVDDLEAPFEPKRYVEKIQAARKHGADVLIIDSASHSWEGIGGVLDMADASSAKGLQKWNRPKTESRKLSNEILHCGMHVIINMRGKDKKVQRKDAQGKDEIISLGLVPIIDERILYELTISLYMLDNKTPEWRKGVGALERLFLPNRFITEAHGEALRAWADGGEPVDHDLQRKMTEGREAALLGLKTLQLWWGGLTKDDQKALKPLKDELKQIADDVDAAQQESTDDTTDRPAFQTVSSPMQEAK